MTPKVSTAADELTLLIERQKVADLLVRYAFALDTRDWQLLGSCFTPDGIANYGPKLGLYEGAETIVDICRTVLSGLDSTQHLIGNVLVNVDDDLAAASATCYVQAQHFLVNDDGESVSTIGGVYRDAIVCDGGTWRIKHRDFEMLWRTGNAGVFALALERGAQPS